MKKWLPAGFSTGFCLVLVFALNTKFGDFPPFGKFMSPFVGFWQNAEPNNTQPDSESPLSMPGLKTEVKVVLDQNRVPHIFAANDHDLYYAQGYLQAKDRLWQMEFQTHAGAGRISEIVGKKALELDRFQRRMGMVYGAEQSLAAMLADPATKQMLEAYSAGVNAYVDQLSPKDYPIEYKLLDYAPEHWTPLKCSLLLKVMAYDLAGRSDDLRMTNILQKYGPAVVKDLFPDYPLREEPIVPVGTNLDFKPLKAPEIPKDFIGAASNSVLEKEPAAELGSNNWVVAGTKSATGYPLLANDPHLSLNLPSIWYQVQLVAPGVNVCGVTIPGAPGVVIGFNKEVSWGVTNVAADVMDWYQIKFKDTSKKQYWHNNQWKSVKQVIEEIKIRGESSLHDTVYYTHHGPVVYDKPGKTFNSQTPISHAMRWIAHEKSNDLKTFYLLNRAKNYQDYVQALGYYASPAQNFIYADAHQDIAVWPNGRYPLKWKNQGKFILDGTRPEHDWQGWIPASHNPHAKNPEQGFLSSANQFSAGPDYPYYLNWQFASPERGLRINQRLRSMQRVNPDSMRSIQNDNFNVFAQNILPKLLAAIDRNNLNPNQSQAYTEISRWQYLNNPEQIGPAIFETWYEFLIKGIWNDEFGTGKELEMRFPSRDRTAHLVTQQPTAKWFDNLETPAKETFPDIVNQSFKGAVDSLVKLHGNIGKTWQWANHKQTAILHIAKLPGFGRENIYIGGGRGIVNATSERNGPSWRMVVALGPQVKSYGVYPGGQSGNPGSYFYDNMIKIWEKGELNKLVYLTSAADKSVGKFSHTFSFKPE